MSGPWGHAAEVFEAEGRLGRLVWKVGGRQAYEQLDGDVYRQTILGGGHVVVHEVVGVDPEALR
jgi:hypothetical protein